MEWLHFCDFHIGGTRGPQAEVLKSLLEKVEGVCGDAPNRISAVFLVGDIAYGGKPEEYSIRVANPASSVCSGVANLGGCQDFLA